MKFPFLLIITCLVMILSPAQAQTDTILHRYKEYLLQTVVPEGNMEELTVSLNARHQWDDINYKDTERANWQVLNHLKRVRDLALVWADPRSPFYHRAATWKTINAALDHWLEKRYKNSNWWHNEIGVPQYMRDIVILVKEKLSPQQFHDAMQVFAQFRVQDNGVGANLTWSADLGFHYGALTGDLPLMKRCLNLILNEIKITTGDGVQPDFSFHQHGSRLQMYQYGQAFLADNVRLAWEVQGTAFAFPEEKIHLLSDFVLEGWQWMARGIQTVPGTMDRSVSRKDALRSADIRKLIPYLCKIYPPNAAVYKAIAARQEGNGSLEGYRYYPYSDFAAYQQKDFSFFLKTISLRTLPSESINGENLKGHLLNSGDGYLIRDGKEYFNLMPVWKWEYLPGVTSFEGAGHIVRSAFTGSVSNGNEGFTAMDYRLAGKDTSKNISGRKFWASHQNLIVCLVAGVREKDPGVPVYTTLDQCLARTAVIVNHVHHVLSEGSHRLEDVKWIWHSGFAYIPVKPAEVNVSLTTFSGTWKSINNSLDDSIASAKIFMPVMPLKEGAQGYILASCSTAARAAFLVRKHPWNVLRNDRDCQAVKFRDGTLMASFYSAGSVKVQRNKILAVDRPCLILICGKKLYASDPAQHGGGLLVQYRGTSYQIRLPDHGSSTSIKLAEP